MCTIGESVLISNLENLTFKSDANMRIFFICWSKITEKSDFIIFFVRFCKKND